jgi:hypothetical protein
VLQIFHGFIKPNFRLLFRSPLEILDFLKKEKNQESNKFKKGKEEEEEEQK